MRKYVTALIGLLLSGYSCSQVKTAANNLNSDTNQITEEQSIVIF